MRWNESLVSDKETYHWFVLGNVMLGTFMAVLDATVVNVAVPDMMTAFGVDMSSIEWVVSGYMLSFALVLPASSWFADRYGNKLLYFIGLFLFSLGSLLCSLSIGESMLVVSRVVEGLGAGIIQPVGLTIVTRAFPPEKRGLALGFWGVAVAASVSFGPIVGGYLVSEFGWKYVFLVNVPIGLIAMFLTWLFQKEFHFHKEGGFDYLGFFFISISLCSLLYAFDYVNKVNNPLGWSSPVVLVMICVFLLFFGLFVVFSLKSKNPLLDLRLFSHRNFLIGNVISLAFGFAVFGTNLILPLFLQNSLGYTALQSGLVFLPVGFIQGCLSPFVGRLVDRLDARYFVLAGLLLLALSFELCSDFSFSSDHGSIMFPLYIRGIGMGLLFSPMTTLSLFGLDKSSMGDASGMLNTLRQVGGSFGVAVLGGLLSVNHHVVGKLAAAESVAYVNSVTYSFKIAVFIMLGGVVLSFLFRWRR